MGNDPRRDSPAIQPQRPGRADLARRLPPPGSEAKHAPLLRPSAPQGASGVFNGERGASPQVPFTRRLGPYQPELIQSEGNSAVTSAASIATKEIPGLHIWVRRLAILAKCRRPFLGKRLWPLLVTSIVIRALSPMCPRYFSDPHL